MFNISILVFFPTLHLPGYTGEDKDEAHEEDDEQGDEAASIRLISLSDLALLPIVNLVCFTKWHGFFNTINYSNYTR